MVDPASCYRYRTSSNKRHHPDQANLGPEPGLKLALRLGQGGLVEVVEEEAEEAEKTVVVQVVRPDGL